MEAISLLDRCIPPCHVAHYSSRAPTKPLSTNWTGSSVCIGSYSRNSLFSGQVWSWVNVKSRNSSREELFIVRAEMFGQLTSGLEAAWTKLKGEDVLTKENIVEPMCDIRRALLEADVSLPVV